VSIDYRTYFKGIETLFGVDSAPDSSKTISSYLFYLGNNVSLKADIEVLLCNVQVALVFFVAHLVSRFVFAILI
jgi:hypothetical protein